MTVSSPYGGCALREDQEERHADQVQDQVPGHEFPLGSIRENWNDAEKISMAPAQG